MKFIRNALVTSICALMLAGCDKFGLKKPLVKADTGEWEITLTTRIPESDVVATKIDRYCLTSEQVGDLLINNRYIPNEESCSSDPTKFVVNKNVTRQHLNCTHPLIKDFHVDLVVGQGENVFDKFVIVEGDNAVSLYSKQMRNAGLKKPPKTGNKVEIIELGVYKGACLEKDESKIRIKNRELSIGTTGTGSAGSEVKTKLSDFLTD